MMQEWFASPAPLSVTATALVLLIAGLSGPVPSRHAGKTGSVETTASLPDMPAADAMRPLRQRIPVDIVRVIDGDTVEVRAHIWLDQQVQARIRLRTIDAPELKAGCVQEAALATQAKEALAALLSSGKGWLGDVGKDKFGGRFLGTVFDDAGRDISQLMLARGHVRPYDGRKRQGWC